MNKYHKFLLSKQFRAGNIGIHDHRPLHPSLFQFQSKIVEWAIRKGKASIFADCGLGKTRQQLNGRI